MKKGFTLSEVLIALGVIGVISAMTLPIILSNVEKMRTVSVLKRAYSDVSNLLVRFNNDNDCDNNFAICAPNEFELRDKFSQYLIEKHKFKQLDFNNGSFLIKHTTFNQNIRKEKFGYLGGYTLVPKSGNYIINIGRSMYDNTYRTLISGKWVYIRASVTIVTNPKHYYKKDYKLKTGRDIFFAFILNDGRLIPNGSSYCYYTAGYFCRDYKLYLTCNLENNPTSVDGYESFMGYGCFQRIIDDGWKITY